MAVALVAVVYPTLQDRIVNAGDSAPDFKIVGDNGKTYTRSDFGGKLLVLNFWATWCTPCVQEVPSLVAFQKTLASDGVVVLGVSVDTNEKQYKEFLRRFRVDFPTARDPEFNVPTNYGTFQFPETYIIGRDGKVLEKVISARDWMEPEYIQHVKSLL